MKKSIFLLTFFISVIFTLNAMAEVPQKIIVALNEKPSFPNRGIKGTENSENPGVAFETLRLLEKELSIPMIFVRLPYKRCLHELESGKMDAVMTASYKPTREKQGAYPKKDGKPDPGKRVYNSSYYVYVQKDSPLKWDGRHFHDLTGPIGAELGFSIVDDLKHSKIKVETFHDAKSCFRPLARGRLAGVAAHETTGQRFIRKYENLRRLEPPLQSKPYYLLFSHQFYQAYPELAEKIWNIATELRESTNEWQTLKEKYFSMETWPEGGF